MIKRYVVWSLRRYWPQNQELITSLPVPKQPAPPQEFLPPRMIDVMLPVWAFDLGVNGRLLVPDWTRVADHALHWRHIDWFSAAFWFLNGCAERAFESRYGPVHSYSFRLKGWDGRIWERAWVNRIALLLRRWAAYENGRDEAALLGTLPSPNILLTHDVDAVSKTLLIRSKQTVFHVYSSLRNGVNGNLKKAMAISARALRFMASRDEYWCFDKITVLEDRFNVRSHFNFYAGGGGWRRNPRAFLIDPGYNIMSSRLQEKIRDLQFHGWKIGLHPSYDTWRNGACIQKEKDYLETALAAPVETCRQHWLHFSWQDTWNAQAAAGINLDTTLGFNDRSAFRNGAALRFNPWDFSADKPMRISALPLVLMDSHLYDYENLTPQERRERQAFWVNEICDVRGEATVVWHQRVMSKDYGWSDGYEDLLSLIDGRHAL